MSEIERMLDQLDRAWKGEAWHGPSLHELIDDLSPEEAATTPPRATHSSWLLLHHITCWVSAPTSRLRAIPLEVTEEMIWKPVPTPTLENWDRARADADVAFQEFRAAVAAIPESQLDEASGRDGLSRYSLVYGVIQHIAYHGGQIGLVKKMLRAQA